MEPLAMKKQQAKYDCLCNYVYAMSRFDIVG